MKELDNLTVDHKSAVLQELALRLASYYRRHGMGGTLTQATTVVRRAIFENRKILFYCDLQGRDPSFSTASLPDKLKVERRTCLEELAEDDWREIMTIWNAKLCRKIFAERFLKRATMWLVRSDEKLAGYGWTLSGCTFVSHYHPMGEHDVHLFDFLVFPNFRRQGINSTLVDHILQQSAAENKVRAYIETSEWNLPMLTSLRRTGFRSFGTARKVSFLGRTIVELRSVQYHSGS